MNSSAGRKLVLCAWVTVILTLSVGAGALWAANYLSRKLDVAVNRSARQLYLSGRVAAGVERLENLEHRVTADLHQQRDSAQTRARRHLDEASTAISSLVAELEAKGFDVASRGVLRAGLDGVVAQHRHVASLIDAGRTQDALAGLEGGLLPRVANLNRRAGEMFTGQEQVFAELGADAAHARLWVLSVLGLLCVVSVAVGMGVLYNQRSVTRVLSASIHDLTLNSRQLAATAAQVSSSSQSVSQAASEQAASLEETAASAAQIHAMTSRNTQHAGVATTCTRQASQNIQEANLALCQMTESMEEIGRSSGRISKIIKVIDDIAFQTNILALNAAVEAARAGEAGMGFAVVADEVRNLAQRSAQAARDTTQLIEESIARAAQGKQKLDEVAATINSITSTANNLKALVAEVHDGSEQQSRGSEQIARTVSRMEQVTQQLAATAEESAASGMELNAHARAVDEIIDTLRRLFSTGTPASPAPPPVPAVPTLRKQPFSGFRPANPAEDFKGF